MEPGAMRAMAADAQKTETLPRAGSPTTTDISLDARAAEEASKLDFNIELPSADTPERAKPAAHGADKQPAGGDMDFKLEFGDINLNLDDKPKADAAAATGEKDAHWYDVQTKFDLAKAYQEMGDSNGAREVLQEVLREGDAQQQADAKKLLEALN
jgi:pilus assembly protein FimV